MRERPRDLERVRDNDKRGCFSPKTAMTHPITHPDSLRPGYNPGRGKSSVTVVTGHMRVWRGGSYSNMLEEEVS